MRGRIASPESVLLRMMHSGRFTINTHWWLSASGGQAAKRAKMRTAWLLMIAPRVATMEDVCDIFLDDRNPTVPAWELPDEAPDANGQPVRKGGRADASGSVAH
jgi:hypothetical protein